MEIEKLGLERVGTHCLECFFGYMRMCSQGDHSVNRALHAAIKSLLITQYCNEIKYALHIRTRVNVGGVKIDKELASRWLHEEIDIDPYIFHDVVMQLAINGDEEQIKDKGKFEEIIMKINTRKNLAHNSSKPKTLPARMTGYGPLARYKNSIVPIPYSNSPLSPFFKLSIELKQKFAVLSKNQRDFVFERWREINCGISNKSNTSRGRAMQEKISSTPIYFTNLKEVFSKLFNIENMNDFECRNISQPDDEYDHLSNNDCIEDFIAKETEFIDIELE